MTFQELINILAYCISDSLSEIDSALNRVLQHINVPKLDLSASDLYTASSTLTSLLTVCFDENTQITLSTVTVQIIRNIVLTMMRHLTSLRLPLTHFCEAEALVELFELLVQTFLFTAKLNTKPLQTVLLYIYQYTASGVSNSLPDEKVSGASNSGHDSSTAKEHLLAACYTRITDTCIQLMQAFPVQDLKPIIITVALGAPYMTNRQQILHAFAYHIVVGLLFTFEPKTRLLLDVHSTYLSCTVGSDFYLGLKHQYSIELDAEPVSTDESRGTAMVELQERPRFMQEFLPLFRQFCKNLGYDISFLKTKGPNPWCEFQYFLVYFLYNKAIYLDESDLVKDVAQSRVSGRLLSTHTTQAYTRSVRRYFEGEIISLPIIFRFIRESSPFIMFINTYTYVMEYMTVFGDRLTSAKQLNAFFNIMSEQLSRLLANAKSTAILVENVLLTFYTSLSLLVIMSESASYCISMDIAQILVQDGKCTSLKMPMGSGSCSRIASCLAKELDTFTWTITALFQKSQQETGDLQSVLRSLLSSVSFYASVFALFQGKPYTYMYSMGILGSYNKQIPFSSASFEDKIPVLSKKMVDEHAFSEFSKLVRSIYTIFSRQLASQGYFKTQNLKGLIYELNTLFFHRCITAQFLLKVAAPRGNRSVPLNFNDVPMLSVKALIDRMNLSSYITKARLASQLYLLFAYGHSFLNQYILVDFYLKKYYDSLHINCEDFFSLISDEITRARVLETDFGRPASSGSNAAGFTESGGKDLIIEDLTEGENSVCMSDVYSTLSLLLHESCLVAATQAIVSIPQNWTCLIYGSRTLKQFISRRAGLSAFRDYILNLLRRPDIHSFLHAALLVCELMCCDAGKLHGYLTFIVEHNARISLIDALSAAFESLIGNFTDVMIESNVQYSLYSSPNGSTTEFVVGLLAALERVCVPIYQDISTIIHTRIALIRAVTYKLQDEVVNYSPIVHEAVITGIQELIPMLTDSKRHADALLATGVHSVSCPFHCRSPDLQLAPALARASLSSTLCSACLGNILSYSALSGSDHCVKIVSLGDVFSASLITDANIEGVQQDGLSQVNLEIAVSQATEQGHYLSAALSVADYTVKLYGSLDILSAFRALSGICALDASSQYGTLLRIMRQLTNTADYSMLSTLSAAHGNILRALHFIHASALHILEIPRDRLHDQTQWAKMLLTANNEMQRCATRLLPAFIGAWSGLLDPHYGSYKVCASLLDTTFAGLQSSSHGAVQPHILALNKKIEGAISLILKSLHASTSTLSPCPDDIKALSLSLTLLSLLSIPQGGLTELAALIVSLTLFSIIFNTGVTVCEDPTNSHAQHLVICIDGCTSALALLHTIHLILSLPFEDIYGVLPQTDGFSEIKHTISTVISRARDCFAGIFTSQEGHEWLATSVLGDNLGQYLALCLDIAQLLYTLGRAPVRRPPTTVVLNTDSTFYRIPFDHSPLFGPQTMVTRIHASKRAATGPKRSFLIDPLGDLQRTRDRMKELLIDLPGTWDGILGPQPAADESARKPLTLLKETSDGIFLFAGHGCGEAVLPLNAVAALQQLPLCLFMGCSSLTHIPVGQAYEIGTYQYYGASPLMIGTLWDGISGELDEITSRFMKEWTRGQRSIYHCLADAIAGSSLRYLVGYSIIVIGDPEARCGSSTFT